VLLACALFFLLFVHAADANAQGMLLTCMTCACAQELRGQKAFMLSALLLRLVCDNWLRVNC